MRVVCMIDAFEEFLYCGALTGISQRDDLKSKSMNLFSESYP
jgi:hypothetical protein